MSAAVVYLRMAPALRDALRAQADASGVSLNAFAVQALAAAACRRPSMTTGACSSTRRPTA
jgi:predicted HicB family RNase H-like nuclease